MGRKIEFIHYLHDNGSINENVDAFVDTLSNNKSSTTLGNVEHDTAVAAVDKFYEDRPFYEVGLRVSLDVDSGTYEILGVI